LVVGIRWEAGGLAALVLTAAVLGLVGIPLAMEEWKTSLPDSVLQAQSVWTASLTAAALAQLVHQGTTSAILAGTATVIGLTTGIRAPRLVGWTVAAAFVGGITQAAADFHPPWTLLEPRWNDLAAFFPSAIGVGLTLAGAGWGMWRPERRPPAALRLPWLTGALGLFALLFAGCMAGIRFESSSSPSPWTALLIVGPATWVSQSGERFGTRLFLIVFALCTGLFVWAGDSLTPWWWAVFLPLGPILSGVALALRHRKPLGALAATLGFVALIGGWPGIPTTPVAGALLVILLFVAFTLVLPSRRTT